MNPRARHVNALSENKLRIIFTNGEVRIFDVTPYLSYPVYEPLRNPSFFQKAFVIYGTVAWNETIDLDPDTLYLESTPLPATV